MAERIASSAIRFSRLSSTSRIRARPPTFPMVSRRGGADATLAARCPRGVPRAHGKTCLTAGRPDVPSAIGPCGWHSPDLPGHGVLRLTGNGDHQVGFAIYTQPVDASLGLNISFDAYQYDSATKRHRGARS